MKFSGRTVSLLALLAFPTLALAAGEHGAHGAHDAKPAASAAAPAHDMAGMHSGAHESMAGSAGDPANVSRTVPVEMNDTMRFIPDRITVKAGETIRFFVINKGKLPHEMVIGMPDEIEEHAAMMRKMPDMAHKEANQITLGPGQRGGIIWKFANAGTVSFACLVPGHKEAGMVGTVEVN